MSFDNMPQIQHTFSMIKPDATKRNITGLINARLESNGLKIVAQKMLLLNKSQAREFYFEHENRAFFSSLIESITIAPVIVQVLAGENAIVRNRDVMGDTNPKDAKDGTIRKEFAIDIEQNSIHGSDSLEAAKREIAFFFSKLEIL